MDCQCQPSAGELARTAIAQARTAQWLCPSSDDPDLRALTVPVRVIDEGRPEIAVADGSLLAQHLARCPVVTVVVPARSPFRSLHLTGATVPGGDAAAADGDRPYRLSLLSLRFEGLATLPVSLVEYHAASPDPFWRVSPAAIQHLEEAHSAELLACVRAHDVPGVLAVVPRRLDRYGLELAIVGEEGVSSVRLPFPHGPVDSFIELSGSLHAIFTCTCRDGHDD